MTMKRDLSIDRRLLLRRLVVVALAASTVVAGYAAVHAAPVATMSFATGETLTADKLNTNFGALRDAINAAAIPPGTIMAYGGLIDKNTEEGGAAPTNPPPAGWLLCNGIQLNGLDARYAGLYKAIGVSFGGVASSMAFNIPDLRGFFLRGLDAGGTVDPGPTRTLGSTQQDALGTHGHGVNDPGHTHDYYSEGDGCTGEKGLPRQGPGSCIYGHTSSASATGVTVQNFTGPETRPKNLAVNYIIKL
jgi:microcystin-dependent protein